MPRSAPGAPSSGRLTTRVVEGTEPLRSSARARGWMTPSASTPGAAARRQDSGRRARIRRLLRDHRHPQQIATGLPLGQGAHHEAGTYGPGYRLVLGTIAKDLGISVVPVREAIRRLEAEGLVTFERNVGARSRWSTTASTCTPCRP